MQSVKEFCDQHLHLLLGGLTVLVLLCLWCCWTMKSKFTDLGALGIGAITSGPNLRLKAMRSEPAWDIREGLVNVRESPVFNSEAIDMAAVRAEQQAELALNVAQGNKDSFTDASAKVNEGALLDKLHGEHTTF